MEGIRKELLLALLFMVSGSIGSVHASASFQEVNGGPICCPTTAGPFTLSLHLPNSVVSGDVIVVAVEGWNQYVSPTLPIQITSMHDSLHTPGLFTTATVTAIGTTFSGGKQLPLAIYVSTLVASGPDTVTVTGSISIAITGGGAAPLNVYVFEVTGVTVSGVTTGMGSGTGPPVATNPTAFQPGAFLLGLVGQSCGTLPCPSVTPGSEFLPVTETSGSGASLVQYSDPVASTTTFPATISASSTWVEAGVALPPTMPIPEYPLGLPILAILILIAYGVVRRRAFSTKKVS